MSDLISRQAVMELFDWWENEYEEIDHYIRNMRQDVLTLPTTDEIVRCKDCRHWGLTNFIIEPTGWCGRQEKPREPDWFCADGEGKEKRWKNESGFCKSKGT